MDTKPFSHQAEDAFSLIELMVAVSIISILSAIAIPSYNTYTLKSKTSELIDYANNLGVMVGNYISETNPTNLACTNMPHLQGTPKTNITNNWTIDATTCIVQVLSQSIYPNSTTITITLTPALSSDGYISWTCSSNSSHYAPSSCQ